jgi:hypothetical protein
MYFHRTLAGPIASPEFGLEETSELRRHAEHVFERLGRRQNPELLAPRQPALLERRRMIRGDWASRMIGATGPAGDLGGDWRRRASTKTPVSPLCSQGRGGRG